ncbi:MAG TPA: TonB-dependent receptor [Panacibacter sp.]|nr:TonB-dependent receptor [Panacibacter sp.]HNP43047.1 TonB-dependent receptor [Panacibacter sp.]
MRLKFLLLAVMLSCISAFAQQTKNISGKVIDVKDGSPLSGVTIKGKGSSRVVTSQPDGSFSISLPADISELEFSFVGFADITVGISDNMLVKMSASEKSLNEVVVVGFGRAVKRNLTGSIAKVSGREVENFPAPSFESALQGKAAGVVVESGSGKIGQSIKVRIRGTSSISASSQPFYVIDGLPVTSQSQSDVNNDPTNPLADINPNDIESIEVLKDASAAAIYGARAANGVVLITTKKGRNNQKTQIELNVANSWSNPSRKWSFLDARQYVDLIELAATSDGTYDFKNDLSGYETLDDAVNDYKSFYEGNILDYFSLGTDWKTQEVNTNWQDQLYNKDAMSKQIDLSVTGGNDKTRFFISGFYNDQDAIVINNTFKRYGGRFNLEHNASAKLSLGINVAVSRSQLNRVSNDNAFSTPGQLVAQLPISPLYDSTGALNKNTLYSNGLFDAQFNSDEQVTFRTLGNAFANYNIIPSLSFRSEFGADILNLDQQAFQGKETIDGGGIGKGNFITSQNVVFNTNNYFTYAPKIGENHKLNAVLGMSYQQGDVSQTFSYGEEYPSDAIKNLAGATSITASSSTGFRYTFLSYFLRGNYSYKNKYLFSASVRTDASSRFGPENRYGWFPAGSVGWVLSEEKFMENISFINFLKLRASWGLTGNAEIGESNYQALYGVSNYPGLPGYIPNQLGNPGLKWEKTAQADAGLEFAVLNNRLNGEVDYYKKHTTDLLLAVNIPATTGYSTILQNLGNMDNQGWEFTLTSRNFDGKFKWTTSINAGYNKNKVLNIGGQVIEGGGGLQRAVEGQPIGVFFMQKFVGVDPETGDAQYLDKDGKITTDYDQAERMVVGKSNPDWTGGFTNTFSYKGFDLNILFTFVQGNNVYNGGGVYMTAGFFNGFDNQTTNMLNAWTQPGDKTDVPRIGYFYGSGSRNSSRWLYEGSYIRLRNVTFGYTMPKKLNTALHITSARLYVAGINLWTATKYPGDPEVNTQTLGNIGGGQDFYTIPQPKTITLGLNVKF